MKKFLVSLAVSLAAALSSPLLAFATTVNGDANQHPIDQSGIMGRIEFVDNGSVQTVTGTATGLVPGELYFSLEYDTRSVPSGPNACQPSGEFRKKAGSDISPIQMLVGFWHNNGDGTGTLSAHKSLAGNDNFTLANLTAAGIPDPFKSAFAPFAFVPGSYVPLSDVHTISIRHATALPPMDSTFILQACGEIHTSG